jgi:acetylornithine deacetylase/succinyl-diaminopimelate desuccinylase-like protein
MKGQDAIILESIARLIRRGERPGSDITLLFTADEEAGGKLGAHWLVENEPAIFENITTAIGEVGGFNLTLPGGRELFFVQVGEKGMWWTRIKFHGTPGHGSMLNPDNAVLKLGSAATAIGAHEFKFQTGPSTQALIDGLSAALGLEVKPGDPSELLNKIGAMGRAIGASFKNTLTPTVLSGGEKVNVVPAEVVLEVDGRYLPGCWEEFEATLRGLVGKDAEITTIVRDIAYEAPLDDPILQNMSNALTKQSPGSVLIPYLMPGGTDGKAFSRLGINCYGFLPMLLPEGWDAMSMFHAANERVPVSSLEFGVDVLSDFLSNL